MTQEILVDEGEVQLPADGEGELLIEEKVSTEVLVETQAELLVDEVAAEVLVEAIGDTLVDETVVQELLEVAEQGPPGPPGPQGPQGIQGLPGANNIDGFEVALANPQPGDVLAFQTTQVWSNDDVLDGGNF